LHHGADVANIFTPKLPRRHDSLRVADPGAALSLATVRNLTPMEPVFWVLGILLAAVVAWTVGARQGRRRGQGQVSTLLRELKEGEVPNAGSDAGGRQGPLRELRSILAREWAPRGAERDKAIGDALRRIATYLRHRVEAPLLLGLEKGGRELRGGADDALDAVEDLEFFLEDPPAADLEESQNLADVVGEVTRDFTAQSDVLVKVEVPPEAVEVHIQPEAFKDAVFLILHNAGEFGGGQPVRVLVGRDGGKAHLRVRDEGPGFTTEALLKAQDPFYSTSPGGLGLGLPHARKIIRAQGGEIFLRNPEEGGAEVEIVLPVGS
jgi:signal transduction histidine kinase